MAQDLDSALNKLRIEKSRKRRPRNGWVKWVAALAVIAALVAGYSYYARAIAPVAVKVVRPERQEVTANGEEALAASGYVIPRDKVEVTSKLIGWVDEVRIEEGEKVRQGDVLIRLDDKEYRAQVGQAEAAVANARARLAELRAGSRPQEIAAARAAVASAEATLRREQADLARLERLRQQEVISQQELDRGRASFGVAQANLKSARENAKLVVEGPRKEEIAAAEATLRQAEANLAYARTQLDYTVIRAPISGTILEKLADKGELVTNTNFGGTRGAKTAVVSIADLRDLQVEIDVNENDLPKVFEGQKAQIRLDSRPDVVFQGAVDEIAPEADRQKGTVLVKVRIIDPRDLVRPEVNAQVTFFAKKDPAAGAKAQRPRVWVPRPALQKDEAGKTVVYVVNGGRAVAREVRVGEESERGVEVLQGLEGSEQVIVSPLEKVNAGRRVEVGGQ